MSLPFYEMPNNPRFTLGRDAVHTMKIVDFLRYIINRDELSIAEHLDQMGQRPFFLVAATGLGKTVAVPVHNLIRLMQGIGAEPGPQPRVWVVEPRIPIAVDQMEFMNSLWIEYLTSKNEPPLPPLFGCITSSSGNVNRDAPIKFVTTGIFEMMATGEELLPTRDRVIIDEAHVTIEQNPGVELGIALSRKAGVVVDYMSATVDTATLAADIAVSNIIRADQQRFMVWKHNLLQPLHDALPELIRATLVTQDLTTPYFPKVGEYNHATEVRAAVTETGRSHGLLAVVNSFAGDHSDIRRLADIIRREFPTLPVLELASEVIRDARRSREFKDRLDTIESRRHNYVILATSVVEMGITFPTLDYVVTMDSGYDQETIGDVTFPVTAPLGVNSLLQRIGRVGRRRPGIAYISREVGADYAELEDGPLNRNGLRYEPIHFPMIAAPLTALAYYACKKDWTDLRHWVTDLNLPSKLHENDDRMVYLSEQLELLTRLGIAKDNRLTPFGEHMEQWIGQADLAYSVQLQQRFIDGANLPEIVFWVVVTALSNTPLVTLRSQHDFFVDYDGRHEAIAHDVEIWEGFEHEDLAAYALIRLAAGFAPRAMFPRKSDLSDDWDSAEFNRWSSLFGIDGRRLRRAGKAVADLWRLFAKINGRNPMFAHLVARPRHFELSALPWNSLEMRNDDRTIQEQLMSLPGLSEISVTETVTGSFEWLDIHHGHAGVVNQDDTPVRLRVGPYAARPIPSRSGRDEMPTWRLAHLGPAAQKVASEVPAGPEDPFIADTLPSTKGRWQRFLDLLSGEGAS